MYGNSALSWGASNSQSISQSIDGSMQARTIWTQVFSSGAHIEIRK